MASNEDRIMQPNSPWVEFNPTVQTRHDHALFPSLGESSSDPAHIDDTIRQNVQSDNTRVRDTSFNTPNHTNGLPSTVHNGFRVESAGSLTSDKKRTDNCHEQIPKQSVHFDHKSDRLHVTIQEPEMRNKDSGNEPAVIQTITDQYYQSPRRRDWQRPLTQRYMKLLFIMSIIGAFLFFPTGIPAVLFAVRTREEFDKGVILGDIEQAQKYARRSQHLIIFSFLLCILIVVLAVSIHTRVNSNTEDKPMYLATHL